MRTPTNQDRNVSNAGKVRRDSTMPPPFTKRGAALTDETSNQQELEVSIHWLAATTMWKEADVLPFVSATLGGADFEVIERGVSGYTRTYKTLYGLRLFTNDERPDMGIHMIADGGACESLGYDALRMIFNAVEMKATRLDLAVDHCPFTPVDLCREWEKDNVRTNCKTVKKAKPGREHIRKCKFEGSPTGDTFYMGSRQSTAFARCYDERGFTRFELEMKGERAEKAATLIFEDSAQLERHTLGMIREFVDFVDAESDTNRSRCTFLPFWQTFITQFERVKVQLTPRPEMTLDRLRDWIEGQVAPSLALYEMAQGCRDSFDDVRRNLRRIGLERLKPKHRALLTTSGSW